MSKPIKLVGVLIFILAAVLLLQWPVINEFPQYIHCWAQSDRYALALGFLQNGFDFFHPQTFVLNSQFPGNFLVPHPTSITAVDFPIYEYCVSILMWLFNSTDPWCFRVFTLIYSVIGLWYLYRLAELFTQSLLVSMSVVCFAIASPVYLYYQAGFLPTIPSLANVFIGLYFYFNYRRLNIRSYFLIAILFMTIAALARLPFSIFLIAMFGYEMLQIFRARKIQLPVIFPMVLSAIFISTYFIYNQHLRSVYGSMFLSQIMPATTSDEVVEFLISIIDKWSFEYFTIVHYLLLLLLLLVLVLYCFKKKKHTHLLISNLLVYSGISLLGCIGYFFLMEYQYINHDYYFLDTFFTVFILFFIFLSAKVFLSMNGVFAKIFASFILLSISGSLILAKDVQHQRRELLIPNDVQTTAKCYDRAAELFESLHIPDNAKVLVLGGDGPNNALVKIKRLGYSLLIVDRSSLPVVLKWPFDYVVAQNSELKNIIYNQHPSIVNELVKIGGNDKLSVFKKAVNSKSNLTSFFGFDQNRALYHTLVTFDSIPPNCSNTDTLSLLAFSGKKSGFVLPKQEYGFTHTINNLEQRSADGADLLVKSVFLTPAQPLNEALLCVSIDEGGKNVYFNVSKLDARIKDTLWHKEEFLFHLPKHSSTDSKISVFIWNKGKNTLFYDDFEISIY